MAKKSLGNKRGRKSAPRAILPVWERGYMSHVYWLGKQKLGRVWIQPADFDGKKYAWQSFTKTAVAATLAEAKRAVEAVARAERKQLSLFDDNVYFEGLS
jgi:hypothetical protein